MPRRYLPVLLVVMIATSLATPLLFRATIQWPLFSRVVLTLALMCPIGILLGIPFPAGIRAVSAESDTFIPWAWGVNGFFTVIGSVGAVILGMMFGFKAVIMLAAACYFIAVIALPAQDARGKPV
jgi:hypothetical protein